MSNTRNRLSPEVRARTGRMVMEYQCEHTSRWTAIESIAPKIGCATQTLHNWIKRAEIDDGDRPGVTTDAAAKLKDLERENKELRQANEILRKASACFAQAELDRPVRRTAEVLFITATAAANMSRLNIGFLTLSATSRRQRWKQTITPIWTNVPWPRNSN